MAFAPEVTWLVALLLVMVAFIAGFVSAIAGAGGTLTLPALLWAGIPPLEALGTNKFQSVFGTLSSAINYFQKGHLDLRSMWPGLCAAGIGAVAGTMCVTRLGAEQLEVLLPVMLIGIAVYFALSPRIADVDAHPRMDTSLFNWLVGGAIGFYGGFFGPGMGSIAALAYTALLGYNMRRATAYAKPLVLITNGTAMVVFALGGHLILWLAIGMSVAQAVGARLGSNLVISRGAALVRPVIIAATVAVSVKLIMEA